MNTAEAVLTDAEAEELVRLMRLYVLHGPALPQMLGDLERSKAGRDHVGVKLLFRTLRMAAGDR